MGCSASHRAWNGSVSPCASTGPTSTSSAPRPTSAGTSQSRPGGQSGAEVLDMVAADVADEAHLRRLLDEERGQRPQGQVGVNEKRRTGWHPVRGIEARSRTAHVTGDPDSRHVADQRPVIPCPGPSRHPAPAPRQTTGTSHPTCSSTNTDRDRQPIPGSVDVLPGLGAPYNRRRTPTSKQINKVAPMTTRTDDRCQEFLEVGANYAGTASDASRLMPGHGANCRR
jgi:hypothetical protein